MPLSWNEIRDRALAFSREWADESSEHAEAKTFWDEFFQVFGVSRRRQASFEWHVKKADGHDGYVDLFWKGKMLAEHKSRGKDLSRAHQQAIDYFPGLKDEDLPRYVVVSDFARFRVHDLDEGTEIEFPLEDFPNQVQVFGFIAGYEARKFREQDPVNIKAAEKLGKLHDSLADVGYDGHQLEVYLVRILLCLFAEDTGIFMPTGAFEDYIRSRTSEDGSDLAARINELFDVLDTPEEKRFRNLDEQLAAFPYINGRLFTENLRTASFDRQMREMLLECCELDWGKISPAIFGSLFQGIMDPATRRNLGAHYTSEQNILKLIGPLFLDDLRSELQAAGSNKRKLNAFHDKLASLQFFDPACGCGNFLVITYREIRLLELEVLKKLHSGEHQQLSLDVAMSMIRVNVDQFHGIEIEEWPSQIARVAIWLIDHQMNVLVGQTFGNAIVRIPLTKSANIVNDNALKIDWNEVLPAEECDYILGNPPFLGHHYQSKEQRTDHAENMAVIKGNGVIDFVANWYVRSIPYLKRNPKIQAALVSTNSISQGEQAGMLWSYLMDQGARINFAHRTFQWTNEARGIAAVHCVIVGFALFDRKEKTIFEYTHLRGDPHPVKAKNISPYLTPGPDLVIRNRSKPICDVPPMKWGNKPTDGGNLILSPEEKAEMIKAEPGAAKFIRPYQGGGDFLNDRERYCLWLVDATPADLRALPEVRKRVDAVRKERLKSKAESTRKYADYPTLFRQISQPDSDYLAIPEVSSERRKYIPIAYFSKDVISSNTVQFVPNAGAFEFGVLSSQMHMAWVNVVCGRLESRFRYSNTIVYNNYPWPVDATDKHRAAIEKAADAVLTARAKYPDSSLSDLYDPLSMPADLVKAHAALDKAVDVAYIPSGGKRSWRSDADRVAFLFDLHVKMTS